MKERELRALLKARKCVEVRQKGSHLRIKCGICLTTIPVHQGEDINPVTLNSIRKQLEPCLGKGWLWNEN